MSSPAAPLDITRNPVVKVRASGQELMTDGAPPAVFHS